MTGWFTRDGQTLQVVAVEHGGADIMMVMDPTDSLRYRLEGLQQGISHLLTARTPGGMSAAVMLSSGIGARDRFQVMSPVGQLPSGATVPAMHFPVTSDLASLPGGMIRAVTEPSHLRLPSADGPIRLADAVAVAGLAAASRGRARAVILVAGKRTVDESRFSAADVTTYLDRIHVPLVVWSPARSRQEGPWGQPRNISSARHLVSAVDDLRSYLDREMIVWLAGSHPPHRIELAPEARDTFQLVGGSQVPESEPPPEEEPLLVAAQDSESAVEPAAAEPTAEPATAFIGEPVDVRVVNVDVVASRGDGTRITDLERADFTVTEDGVPVEVTNFQAPMRRPDEAADAAEDEAEVSDRTGSVGGEDEARPLHLVIVYDTAAIRPTRRGVVNRALGEFLKGDLPASARVMVVTHEGAMRLRETFTGTPEAAVASLEDIGHELAGYTSTEEDRRLLHREIVETRNDLEQAKRLRDYSAVREAQSRQDQLVMQMRVHTDVIRHEVQNSIRAIEQLVSGFGGIAGRKLLLYVGDALSLDPANDLYFNALRTLDLNTQQTAMLEAERGVLSVRSDVDRLVGQANANGVVMYTLTPPSAPLLESVEMQSPGSLGLVSAVQMEYEAGVRQTLCTMSDGTGGRCQVAGAEPERLLEELHTDLESTYWLAYQPDHPADGAYHRIRVEVSRPRVRLQHREGYFDATVDDRIRDRLAAALRFDVESNPLAIQLSEEPPRALDDGRFMVPLQVRVPVDRLALVPDASGGQRTCRARLLVTTAGDDGRTAGAKEFPISFAVAEDRVASGERIVYAHDVHLTLERGDHTLAIGLWDEVGMAGSFIRQTIHVAEGSE